MVYRSIILLFLTLALCTGCEDSTRVANIDGIPAQPSVLNLHDTLTNATVSTTQELYQNFGPFWRIYAEDILRLGPSDNDETLQTLDAFLHDPMISELGQAINQVHGTRYSSYQESIDQALRRYKYFFPDSITPQAVLMNSGFNFGIYPADHQLGIGLDFYLGKENGIIQTLDPNMFPNYLKEKMDPDYLVSDALRGWLLVNHQDRFYDDTDLLSTAMYWGKILYLMDIIMPDAPDFEKINFTRENIEWCKQNERNLWISFSNQEILYETTKFEINRWITDGPFTRAGDLPQDCPSRIGTWIAWQVVRDYMARNKDVTPGQLLEETNNLKMLNAYRPG